MLVKSVGMSVLMTSSGPTVGPNLHAVASGSSRSAPDVSHAAVSWLALVLVGRFWDLTLYMFLPAFFHVRLIRCTGYPWVLMWWVVLDPKLTDVRVFLG